MEDVVKEVPVEEEEALEEEEAVEEVEETEKDEEDKKNEWPNKSVLISSQNFVRFKRVCYSISTIHALQIRLC